ncbi:MAG: glycoside hydrolase family 26 protein [Tannerellaceae bacterium]|jgi:hypothetical protein|nr:glycoside hydrolase family 26 protein [Tannerellaceae bacterium]
MVKQINRLLWIAGIVFLCSCSSNKYLSHRAVQIFEPPAGKCLVFIGQDLGAVGGLPGYSDGYCDAFATPAGVTVYLGLNPGGKVLGLMDTANWGSGDCCANQYAEAKRFDGVMIAVGLAIVGQETNIVQGKLDGNLGEISLWIKQLSPRPVFLRIGYEFDGHDWNHYQPETYIAAYRYIKNFIDNQGINNVAYVWQSKGWGTPLTDYDKWYPGDEYVDWYGYSYFNDPDDVMIRFARTHGKPVIIAEATPTLRENGKFIDADLKKDEVARAMWDKWFTPFFNTIENNADVIKAFSYINVDWYTQRMWVNDAIFNQCDSRIQKNGYISKKWADKMKRLQYIVKQNRKP